jgi:hypothetical protein
MKHILWLILLIGFEVKAQLPGPVIGTAVAIPAGSFNCTQSTFPAPVGVSNEGDPVTMCFNYYNVGPINLSYLLVNGLCGPFPLYNSLSFQIFDSTGTQFITSGTIVPIANNITITSLTPSTYYTICYTWVPNCPQFSGCPLIYTSALPIELLYFNGEIKDNNVILKWATATETNVDKFIIEKTYDAITFTTVTEIKVEGNSTNTNFYETIDYNETNELVYYKLVEVTIEGQRIDQSIIVVNRKNQNIPTQIFDITGKELNDYKSGFNIVRQGEKYYKIIKL